MADNEGVAVSSESAVLPETLQLVADVPIWAHQIIVHGTGNCLMRFGLQRCYRAAGERQWLIVATCVTVRILEAVSNVGLQCACGVIVHLAHLGRLICSLLFMLMSLRT